MNRFFQFIKEQRQWWRHASITNRMRIVSIVFMQIALLGAFVLELYERSWLTLFICAVGLVVVRMPSILSRNLRVHFPLEFELLLNVFIYGSIFLGEIRGYYTRFWWWDIVLHASSGIALGFIGFLILYSLYRSKRLETSPALIALFSFCFALALGALWEILEFAVDNIFGFSMQKNGLRDTIWDLIMDATGAFVVAISGYFYVRDKRQGMGVFKYFLSSYFTE